MGAARLLRSQAVREDLVETFLPWVKKQGYFIPDTCVPFFTYDVTDVLLTVQIR